MYKFFFFIICFFFFFNDTATTEIYTLSLHDALPISDAPVQSALGKSLTRVRVERVLLARAGGHVRSEEHTSELQSLRHLVCRLLLEKKKRIILRQNMNKKRTNQSLK